MRYLVIPSRVPSPAMFRRVVTLVLLLLIAGCGTSFEDQPRVERMTSPAGPSSGQVRLTSTPSGQPLLSWIERISPNGPHELRLARLEGSEWTDAGTVATGTDWFVNWADFPAVAAVSDSILYAHFLRKTGPATYAYHVMVTRSDDGGRSWSTPSRLHTDSTETEHGFVSLLPMQDELMAVWLDGREMHNSVDGHGSIAPMTLRAAAFDPEGAIRDRYAVDTRVCDCCQTAAVQSGLDVIVAYRDRTEEEIRDISVSRFDGESWSEGTVVGDDNWYIPGCPVNGPAMDSDGERIAIAWFTAAEDDPRVQVAFSDDGGRSFTAGQRIDDGRPLGRVDIRFMSDGAALAIWFEEVGERAVIRARRITPEGTSMGFEIAETSLSRASGFPALLSIADGALVGWIAIDPESQDTRVEVSRVHF